MAFCAAYARELMTREGAVDSLIRKIYLVRHAESSWNRERRVQGTCLEVPLSPTGEKQARLLGPRLRALALRAVYSSDARRTLETARRALGDDYPIEVSDRLRELSLGEWEGRLISDLEREDPGKLAAWYRKPSTVEIARG